MADRYVENRLNCNYISTPITNDENKLVNILLFLIGIGIYSYVLRERWMVWDEKQYVEIAFGTDLYGTRLKVYKEERVVNFIKVDPICEDEFFNADATPCIWY